MMMSSLWASTLLLCFVATTSCWAWTRNPAAARITSRRVNYNCRDTRPQSFNLWAAKDNDEDNDEDDDDDDDKWDDDVDYDKELPKDNSGASPDPSLSWNAPAFDDDKAEIKLGIDLGSMLDPLSEKEAAELKAAASEVINDAIASGIDEIEQLRARMKREFESQRKAMQFASQLEAQRASEQLLSKIDALTDDFMSKTQAVRASTKLAAAADKSMAEGQAVELGVWGTVKGAAVLTDAASGGGGALLGSVQAAVKQQAAASKAATGTDEEFILPPSHDNRILIIADTKQDDYAKQLVEPLTEKLKTLLPSGLDVQVFAPTATLPLGGDNAACVVLFATSLSDKSSVKNALERLLRKTFQTGGAVGLPPTQFVMVSTVGVERTNKMPYSMQNLMGGGKLEKRRQMEESLVTAVQQHVLEPPLDYTLCRFGELKSTAKEAFAFGPFDALDGTTAVDTAVTVLANAIALQPSARNATLSCVGSLPAAEEATQAELLQDAFLQLDGPEVWRLELGSSADLYDQLVDYMKEWAVLLAETGKGLTTPIRAVQPASSSAAVQLLFLPTSTGKNYLSKDEERQLESNSGGGTKTKGPPKVPAARLAKEGGIEVVVEKAKGGSLRVRAKRCMYADDAVIKELSEETIVNRLQDAIAVWEKEHP